MKMFEYMASKRPIVASDVSSLREVLNEKNAIMFVPDDGEDLAAQIQKVADDTAFAERIAHAAYDTVQEFSWAKRAVIIDTFLNSIV